MVALVLKCPKINFFYNSSLVDLKFICGIIKWRYDICKFRILSIISMNCCRIKLIIYSLSLEPFSWSSSSDSWERSLQRRNWRTWCQYPLRSRPQVILLLWIMIIMTSTYRHWEGAQLNQTLNLVLVVLLFNLHICNLMMVVSQFCVTIEISLTSNFCSLPSSPSIAT